MLEIKFVRQNLSIVQKALSDRGKSIDLEMLSQCDIQRKEVLLELEQLRSQRNSVSDRIAAMKKSGENVDTPVLEMREVSLRIKDLEKKLTDSEQRVQEMIMEIPNIPHASVPVGKDSDDNALYKTWGTPRSFEFEPLPHWTIGEKLHIFDFEKATQITGARFPLYFGAGARLERSLINLMLDRHTTINGYLEVLPPFMVNRSSMTHTGQLPKFEADLFKMGLFSDPYG
jgi:seryl-tRNA synthetase